MAARVFAVSLASWNSTQLAALLNTALGLTGVTASGTATSITVSHPSITAANDAAIQVVLTAYVFDPLYGVAPEVLSLRGVVPTLRQWAVDAVTEVAAWDAQTQAQKNAANKIVIQRFGLMVDRLADLLTVSGNG